MENNTNNHLVQIADIKEWSEKGIGETVQSSRKRFLGLIRELKKKSGHKTYWNFRGDCYGFLAHLHHPRLTPLL
jgi:hypothetical protein